MNHSASTRVGLELSLDRVVVANEEPLVEGPDPTIFPDTCASLPPCESESLNDADHPPIRLVQYCIVTVTSRRVWPAGIESHFGNRDSDAKSNRASAHALRVRAKSRTNDAWIHLFIRCPLPTITT